MEQNLPATTDQDEAAASSEEDRAPYRQDVSVAFLPLAIVSFLVLAFAAAAWTILVVG